MAEWITEKVKIRLQELKEYLLTHNKDEAREYFMKEKGWKKDKFFNAYNLLVHGKKTTNKTNNIRKIRENKTECYFCREKNGLLQHHISYVPEKIIVLCFNCHGKIHHVIQQYHTEIKYKDEQLINIRNILERRI